MLEARSLTKYYGHTPAVRQVSFTVRPGEILGYLGPNGAGKSTTVKMLTGLIEPSEGQIFYRGQSVYENFTAFQRRVGYVPEVAHLYPHLSGREYLQLMGRLRGMPRRVLEPKMDEFLRAFNSCRSAKFRRHPLSHRKRHPKVGPKERRRRAEELFRTAHTILLVFLLIGVRHLFLIPVELKANWAFQITEGEGRQEWLRAVDRFVLYPGALAMLILPFPLEVYLFGWRAVGESLLSAIFAVVCYELVFSSWEKLPFTCFHLPGKTPAWFLSLYLLGLLVALPTVNWLLLECLYHPAAFVVILTILLAAWTRLHATRRDGWRELRLLYEEAPEPAIHGLNLLK